jgi:prepilin-type processing-associated H-X9-DG protein
MYTVRAGFSFIGTLIVGGMLAFVAALLFPVLVTAGEQAPMASCQSNLREIGTAIKMYMEDYDGAAPLARSVEIDARPIVREGRTGESPFVVTGGPALLSPTLGECTPLGRPGLWPLHMVLDCYVSRPDVWRDPEDRGDLCCRAPAKEAAGVSETRSAHSRHGSSYQYNQRLVWVADTQVGSPSEPKGRLDPVSSAQIVRPSEVPLAFDGEGSWHGTDPLRRVQEQDPYLAATAARGYNVVFADGHVRFVPAEVLLNRQPGRPTGLLYRDPRK